MTGLLNQLQEQIGTELSAVDQLFHQELTSDIPSVNALVRHVSRFRGKMLRPMLVLLSGQVSGSLTNDHTTLATVSEMVHMATLVHDDVLDEAELRRKGATINHLRGNEAAVLLGDYLISHSYHLCAAIGSQVVSRTIAQTTNQVCEGELLQIHNRGNWDLDERTYHRIILLKTAALTAVCCRLGAQLAGASRPAVAAMELFGRNLGMAFQIQDDILDIIGDASTVGKTLGTDVEKGKMTLPMIHFLAHAPSQHGELLRSLLQGGEADKAEKIRNLIIPSGSIPYAQGRAAELIDQAKTALDEFASSPARDLLLRMADFSVHRRA